MRIGGHLRNFFGNLRWRKGKVVPPKSAWDSSKMEELFNAVVDKKEEAVRAALDDRCREVTKFLKREKERWIVDTKYKKELFQCDSTKVPKYDTIEELDLAIGDRLIEINDLATQQEIQLAWLAHLQRQRENLEEIKALETEEAVKQALAPPDSNVTYLEGAGWAEPGDDRIPTVRDVKTKYEEQRGERDQLSSE